MTHTPKRLGASTAEARLLARKRRRTWTIVASSILLLGVALSILASALWRSSVADRNEQSFDSTTANVTATLGTLIRREDDFVAELRAALALEPQMSTTRFKQWFTALEGAKRETDSPGTTIIELVPARGLASFQARRNADPGFRALVGSPTPIRASGRSHYCLMSADVPLGPDLGPKGGLAPFAVQLLQGDWCYAGSPEIGARAPLMAETADSGQFVALPLLVTPAAHIVFLQGAFYRRGTPLATVTERRAALAGWVLTSFDLEGLIQTARRGNPGITVSVSHLNPGARPVMLASIGARQPKRAFTAETTLHIHGAWSLLVSGVAPGGAASASAQGALIVLAGTVMSLLAFAMVIVLTRSRERALEMVSEKTGELQHLAMHDPLTGLPNRLLALDRAEQMLARARRHEIPIAALFVDLDGFKAVNDTFGHAAGDEVLRIVAARLASVIRQGDTAARLGGDEFIVLVEGSTLDAGPELVAERLLNALRQPYPIHGGRARPLSLTASVGVAYGVRANAEELITDADVALHEAKVAGKSRYVLFESGMQTSAQDRMTLEMDLAEALEREELFLVYQPMFELSTERVTGLEALLRWRHPTKGILAPGEFMAVAEASALIVPIGRWVLEEACRQCAPWLAQGLCTGVSVNVSARQFDLDELIVDVQDALLISGIDPQALTLELTETTVMRDADATALRLDRLKALGVRIAIDDFGTGYSSLAYLRQFPADVLKIDRVFVNTLAGSEESAALMRTLVALGKALRMETLAEGIEELDQLHALLREKCDSGQGFLYSRPLTADAIEAFLRERQGVPAHASAH